MKRCLSIRQSNSNFLQSSENTEGRKEFVLISTLQCMYSVSWWTPLSDDIRLIVSWPYNRAYDNTNLHSEITIVCQSVVTFPSLDRHIATVVISTAHVHFYLGPQVFVVRRIITLPAPFCSWKARGNDPIFRILRKPIGIELIFI